MELDPENRRLMFFQYIQKNRSIPPKRLFVFDCDVSDMAINHLTQLLLCIISRAMVGASDIDRHVKLFLTQTNIIERVMDNASTQSNKRKKNLPLIIGRMNFISLLNLQATVDRYGPMRLLWELGVYGEGSIPTIKQLISNTQKGYASPVVKKYLHKIAIQNSFLQLRESINNSVNDGQTAFGIQSMMYECIPHKKTQNTCEQSDGSNLKTNLLYDCDGTKICNAIDPTKETNNNCPIGNNQFVIPVVISLLDNTIYMFDKKGRNSDDALSCQIIYQ